MLTGLRARLERVLPRGALLLATLTFASYVVGLLRDRTFARTFGAGDELDAYNAALVLPELTLDVLVVAGLTSAFIPMFTRTRRDDPPAADAFSRTVLTAVIGLMAIADTLLFLLAPQTIAIVGPGFSVEQQALYTDLFRIMCVTGVIFAASLALGEMLVARQRFLSYGLAPILYNGGIALGALVLAPGFGIQGVAVGTVGGALLHLGIRIVEIRRTDFRFRPELYLRTRAFREYVRLSIPKTVSQPIEPLTYLFFTSVASTFAAGSISQLSYARNFQSVPVSLIGVAFSVAAFPLLAGAAAAGDRSRFVRLTVTNIVTITLLTSAAAIALYIVANPVIRLFLGGGAFDAEDVAVTTALLHAFALSIPLESLTQVLSRAIYSTHNTALPALASVLGLLVTVATVSLLSPAQGLLALPLSFVAGMATKVLVLGVALVMRVRAMTPAVVPVEDG